MKTKPIYFFFAVVLFIAQLFIPPIAHGQLFLQILFGSSCIAVATNNYKAFKEWFKDHFETKR